MKVTTPRIVSLLFVCIQTRNKQISSITSKCEAEEPFEDTQNCLPLKEDEEEDVSPFPTATQLTIKHVACSVFQKS